MESNDVESRSERAVGDIANVGNTNAGNVNAGNTNAGNTNAGDANAGNRANPRVWPTSEAPAVEGLDSSPDASVAFHSVGFSLSTTGYAVSRRFHEILDPLDLEPRDFALLRAVRAAEGLSQQALAERMRIQPSRMVAFIDALEARGLLERRQRLEDRRLRALYLTDAGQELLGRAFARAVEHERDLCADLSEQEREQLLGFLQRVALRLGLPFGVHAAHGHSALADE